ncbi:MAG: hypothetical protein QXH27_02640 [Candidatus Micrarchaeia archaeon]
MRVGFWEREEERDVVEAEPKLIPEVEKQHEKEGVKDFVEKMREVRKNNASCQLKWTDENLENFRKLCESLSFTFAELGNNVLRFTIKVGEEQLYQDFKAGIALLINTEKEFGQPKYYYGIVKKPNEALIINEEGYCEAKITKEFFEVNLFPQKNAPLNIKRFSLVLRYMLESTQKRR